MGKYSRDKGKRGELDVKNRLGGSAKRTGHSFQPAADVITRFAAYSVKNKTIGGGTIISELQKLQALEPGRNHYVVFKPKRGVWVCAEMMEQHVGDHGDDELHFGAKEGEAYGVNKSHGDSGGTEKPV